MGNTYLFALGVKRELDGSVLTLLALRRRIKEIHSVAR